jgi:predicted amidophosphoribosyltransferase
MLLDHLLTPLRCPGCDVTAPSLCASCRDELAPWRGGACLRCGAERGAECLCPLLPDGVVELRSRWVFEGLVADLVEEAKYHGRTWPIAVLRAELTGWLRSLGAAAGASSLWVPVPPSPRRVRRVGFDLAVTLARWGARASRERLRARALARGRGRPPQATLDREARLQAIEGVFVARRRLVEPDVILVDDVITTGATVTACARALAGAGARTVRIVSLARTPRRYSAEGPTRSTV